MRRRPRRDIAPVIDTAFPSIPEASLGAVSQRFQFPLCRCLRTYPTASSCQDHGGVAGAGLGETMMDHYECSLTDLDLYGAE
jgi:hypothetical protein